MSDYTYRARMTALATAIRVADSEAARLRVERAELMRTMIESGHTLRTAAAWAGIAPAAASRQLRRIGYKPPARARLEPRRLPPLT